MNKKLYICLILVLLILSGCKPQPQLPSEEENQFQETLEFDRKPFLLGTTGFFPQKSDTTSVEVLQNFWKNTNLISDIYGVHTDWTQLAIIEQALNNTKLDLVVGMGFEKPEEWENQSEEFIERARNLLGNSKIKYFFFGNEINLLQEKYPDEFPKFIEVHKKIYIELKKDFPDVKIFSTFQFETLIGKGYLVRGEKKLANTKLDLIKEFESHIDLVGITSYPMLDYPDPQNIPADYYDVIKSYSSKPIAFTEIGWLSKENYPEVAKELQNEGFAGSEDEQVVFFDRFIEITRDQNVEFANWLGLHDLRDWENITDNEVSEKIIFDSVGLRYFDGIPKKIWFHFGTAQNLPEK